MNTYTWAYRCVGPLLLLSVTGCEKETACGAEENTVLPIQVLSPALGPGTSGQSNKTFVVNSAAELAAVVPAGYAPTPAIDFTRYTLLGGLVSRTSGVSARQQQVVKDCRGTIIYSAQIVGGVISMPSTLFFGVLVDKLPRKADIKFEVDDYK